MLPLMTSALPKSGIWFSSVPSLKFLRTKNAAPRSKFPEQDPHPDWFVAGEIGGVVLAVRDERC